MPAAVATRSISHKRGTMTKRIILDTSAGMFREKGYDRTTLDDIAKTLLVTKPSLYYHFSSKEEILLQCVAVAYLHFQQKLALRDNVTFTGRKRVEIFLRLYLEVIMNDLGTSMVIADDRVMSAAGRLRYGKLRRVLNGSLLERMELGVADESIMALDTTLTTYAIFGMFNWVSYWSFQHKGASVDDIYERFLSIIFDGIGAPPGKKRKRSKSNGQEAGVQK